MAIGSTSKARVIPFIKSRRHIGQKWRKIGLNTNKEGSVRKINGKAWVDFRYMGERVREPSGLVWNKKNAKTVREQLDRIIAAKKTRTFKFAEVFPNSKKAKYFTERERALSGEGKTPDEVLFKDYAWKWYDLHKDSGRVAGRTMLGYKSYMSVYLIPFFGDLSFGSLNANVFDEFISWARKRKCRGRQIANETVNKFFVPLRMICKKAAIEFGWGSTYNPFFDFERLPQSDPLDKILPFSVEEQKKLVAEVPDHWKPYFSFAFSSGIRQGEQIGLKPGDIDWSNSILHIRRAMTFDENGKRIEGGTKNRYSRRKITLIPVMYNALLAQKEIYEQFSGDYFFCSPTGSRVDPSHLRRDVWTPALVDAGLRIREMKQTRHSFATVALSCGENPLWIARVMGHRNTEMIIKVYSKYIENAGRSMDGAVLNQALQGDKSNKNEAK